MSDPVELYEIITNHGKRIARLEKELAELRRILGDTEA